MQRTDIAVGMAGNVSYVKFTIGYTDLNATAALTLALSLQAQPPNATPVFQIPQGGVMLGAMVHHTVAFAGTAITAVSVSLGVLGGSATFFTPAFDILQAVANNTLQQTSMFKSGTVAAATVQANFTAVGANLTALTAGSVDIFILYLNVTTPTAASAT